MKKYIFTIVTIFLFFATVNFSFAKEGYIEKLLDFNYGVEEFDIENFQKLDNLTFRDKSTSYAFSNFKIANKLLKKEFISLYKQGIIDYNSINAIVVNYNQFVYYTNRMFIYKSIKEKNPHLTEVNFAISKNYKLARSYYVKIKNIMENNLNK